MITPSEMQRLIEQAREDGYRQGRQQGREDHCDALQAMEHDDSDFGDEFRAKRMQGCMPDDTTDSRGRPLRPKVNEAGEPCWM